MQLFLTNTLSGKKEAFLPINNNNIKIYVCGPTVYKRPHIGNTRSSVIFDILYRLLSNIYPKVTYIRNITDIDDKIITTANKNNKSIKSLSRKITKYFHEDLTHLNCLTPTYEPKATQNIYEMIKMIKKLIKSEHAYMNKNHVYFNINSYQLYGNLSKRQLLNQDFESRIKISKLKKNPLDFVLWKPRKKNETTYFSSPWGEGRPGWHIECSVMSKKYLGNEFDIHGGGIDLIFPHHENEIAQSICESQYNKFASYWIHNGLLTINNKKMSKSLENFITVKELLNNSVNGIVLRYFYLTTHYKKPIDFNKKALEDARKNIFKLQKCFQLADLKIKNNLKKIPKEFIYYLSDDLNTPLALSYIQKLSNKILNGKLKYITDLYNCCSLLGIIANKKFDKVKLTKEILKLAEKRKQFKENKNWKNADNIRTQIKNLGYKIIDTNSGYKITYGNLSIEK